MVKKIGILLCILALCGGMVFAGGEQEAGQAGSEKEITLNLWHIHGWETRRVPLENALKRFEAANPGVKVIPSHYENDPYKTKLKTVSGQDFPDVFHSWGGGWLKSFVDAGLVADITEASKSWADEVSPEALAFNTYYDKVYGSPYIISGTYLYYNKEIFRKYGLDFPKTYDELMDVCETLKNNGIIPFALGNKSKWPGAQHFVHLSMRLGGPDIFQRALDGDVKFTDPAFIKAGQMLQDMVDKEYFPAGVNGINYDTGGSRMMFYTEKTAMILQTSGFLSNCKAENPDFYKTKLGVGMYPEIEGAPGKSTDILSGENAFSVSASCEHKDIAAKLVGFLSTDEQYQKDLVAGGTLGSRLGLETEEPLLKTAMTILDNATYMQNYVDQTLNPELAEKHKDTVQALFGKTMTPREAAEEMQKVYEATK